jgi:hypothetical protein
MTPEQAASNLSVYLSSLLDRGGARDPDNKTQGTKLHVRQQVSQLIL